MARLELRRQHLHGPPSVAHVQPGEAGLEEAVFPFTNARFGTRGPFSNRSIRQSVGQQQQHAGNHSILSSPAPASRTPFQLGALRGREGKGWSLHAHQNHPKRLIGTGH